MRYFNLHASVQVEPVPSCSPAPTGSAPERKRKRIPAIQLLWLLLARGLLFLLAVSAITIGADSFRDSHPNALAETANAFAEFLARRDGLPFLHFMASLFAAMTHVSSGLLKLPAYRLRLHPEFARSLGIQASCDGQIFVLLILANPCAGLGT